MTYLAALLLILSVAALVARPLLKPETIEDGASGPSGDGEVWQREKAVALVAIKEAEFDHATGKLTDDDYQILRGDYEERALNAMDQLDRLQPADAASAASGEGPAAIGDAVFCTDCGRAFGSEDRFCGGCGAGRA